MVSVSMFWAPGSYQWGGCCTPPYKIRLNVVNALIFAPEHHIIKRKLFWSFGNDWTWWRHRDVTFLQQTFENDVIWRHVTSWHHHHIKLGRNVSLIDISLLSKYEVIWSIIDKVMAIYVSIVTLNPTFGLYRPKKYEIGQNIRVNGYKCFIFVPQLTTKKTNISWNFGENSTRWRHFIALCLHAISMGGVVPAFWGTHRDIKKRHWKKNCPSFFLSRKMSHVSVRISFSVFLLDQNR